MEHKLCEAAIKGDIDSLDAIIQKDPLILHKFADGCFNGAASPLHVATSNNKTHFVEELLHRQPELTEVLDSQLRSALHLASAKGHNEIVETLLNLKPELKLRLTEVLDSQQRSALHLASAMGHHQIVKVLVKANPKMCLVRDREGKNPLHVAAMEGKINALEELVGACPQAARERVDRNETILHLCVKHKQLESLKKLLEMIKGCDFVNAKDSDGNTILHLAILYEHFEIAGYVLWMETKDVNATNGCGATIEKSLQKITRLLGKGTNEEKETIDVNATNASGHTAMDILLLGSGNKEKSDRGRDHGRDHVHDVNATNASGHTAMDILFLGSGNKEESDRGRVHVPDLLLKANAKQAKDLIGGDWLTNKRESLMVVASLIATMAFQAGVSPPGGVWQDNKEGHKAGEAVMAYNNTYYYKFFLRCNTIGFVASLSTILLLVSGLKFRNKAMMWILIVTMWLAITSMAITYALSNHVVTPSDNLSSLSNANKIGLIVWSSVMALLLVKHTFGLVAFFAKEMRRKKKAIKRMMNRPSSLRNFIGGKDGRASSPLPLKS